MEIINSYIYNKLNKDNHADPNKNYDPLEEIVTTAMDKFITIKMIKFNKYKHKKTSLITQCIIRSIKFRNKLYSRIKQTPVNTKQYHRLKTNLHTYSIILKRNIRLAKQMHYQSSFENHKHNVKKTWCLIKEIIQKNPTKEQFPDSFKVDGEMVSDKCNIANKFNLFFFTNIGPTLASKITTTGGKSYKDCLKNPIFHTFSFKPIEVDTTVHIIVYFQNLVVEKMEYQKNY